jgi:hypothetical protein
MAKSEKAKLPKTVAGLKVPKALRKSGVLETLVGSHAGRQILADALVAAAAAAAAALVKDRSDAPNGGKGRSKAVMSDATQAAAGAVAGFITDAAQNLFSGALGAGEAPKQKPAPRARTARPKKPAAKQESAAESGGE